MPASLVRPIEDGAEIASPKLIQLFEYWSAKAPDRVAPTRADINPAEIPRLLPWVWLLDVIDGGSDFRLRLGGEKLIDFVGRRVSGETIGAHRTTPFIANVAVSLTTCVRDRKPLLRKLAPTSFAPRNYVQTEVLYLPLSDNGTDISQIFGGFATVSPIALPLHQTAAPN